MIYIFSKPEETIRFYAEFLIDRINLMSEFHIALSGGNTPKLLFKELKENFSNSIDWSRIHFYWGDERCVDRTDPESNFGSAYNLFLKYMEIPEQNIHFIDGSKDPKEEAENYSEIIKSNVQEIDGVPSFDMILLGLGDDGHTASIFPNQMELLNSPKICETAYHPETYQQRITLTGTAINNAKCVTFLILGGGKKEIVDKVINKRDGYEKFPSSFIQPKSKNLNWFLDSEAGELINPEVLKNS
jgi:6-phosphogluconolactonase